MEACVRRSRRFFPPAASPDEFGVNAAERSSFLSVPQHSVSSLIRPECLHVVSINIRSLLANIAELRVRLATLKPHIVCLQETWLDESVESVPISGYQVVSRRDREGTAKDDFGGVLVLRRDDFEDIVELKKSVEDERLWCCVHSSMGPILLGNWYRPPDDDATLSMSRCRCDLESLDDAFVGTILVGDFNVHHRRWLVHSSRNSNEGRLLHDICVDHGLMQGVKEPTRGKYLLDLVLSDLLSMSSVKVYPPIADHCVVACVVDVETVISDPVERVVWDFRKADWSSLQAALSEVDWRELLTTCDVDTAAERLTETILQHASAHIPRRKMSFDKRSHPWLTDRALQAIHDKCAAYGTPSFATVAEECRKVVAEEYRLHISKLRAKIAGLKRGSKKWWSLNRQLLNKKSKTASIPPLKNSREEWVTEPARKAELLSEVFDAKCVLPESPETVMASEEHRNVQLGNFLLIRSRWVRRILKKINPDKSTGPDALPGRILQRCASELAVPLAMFSRRLLDEGAWPDVWKLHWIHPLFKKGSASDPKNYRGVHLTTVLSKTVERVLSLVFVPYLDKAGIFGRSQWAFRPGHSCRDLITLKFAQWIRDIGRGRRIGLFLSDISGAFDRVDSEILLRKCAAAGLGDKVCGFLRAFLAPRRAIVLVQGSKSTAKSISNEVYQGTVLGPPLWNVHFADVTVAASENDFRETKFADDLSCDKVFDSTVSDASILEELATCQRSVHRWGVENRVEFDPKKEEMKILHVRRCHGSSFKFLGPIVDTKLVMDDEVRRIRNKTRPKVKAILRTRPYYTVEALVGQYKAHVLPLLESSIGAIYHASKTQLDRIDSVQRAFLHGIETAEDAAFLRFNLAPSQLRRDIAILGLLFKIAKGKSHPDFELLFPRDVRARNWHTRANESSHDMRLVDICNGNQSDLINRSIFGAVRVFNRLPSFLLEVESVQGFQRLLTERVRHFCRQGFNNWQCTYSNRNITK